MVRALAVSWSRDRPEAADDLAQEALLALWLKDELHAPRTHQYRTALHRILSVRKLGKSVDGKLDATYQRNVRFLVVSLEEPLGWYEGERTLGDLLPDPRSVERFVLAKLTLIEMISVLNADEQACVAMLCQGFSAREVARRTALPYPKVRQKIAAIREKLRPWREA